MQYFLYVMVAIWSVFGLGLMIAPKFTLKLYKNIGLKRNLKPWFLLALMVGALFFFSMQNLKINTFGYAMGLLAVFKGLYLLAIKKEKVREIFEWWLNAPVEIFRIWGMLLVCLALVLLSLIK